MCWREREYLCNRRGLLRCIILPIGSMVVYPVFCYGQNDNLLKYKIVICSKYTNQHEIRLHKRFLVFDFIYYNNIFIVPMISFLLLMLATYE